MHAIPAADVLDEMLSSLSVRAHIAFRGLACERWGIAGPPQGRLGFHVVLCGRCWARLPDVREPVELREGALLLYRPNGWHLLADSADTVVVRQPDRIGRLVRDEQAPHVGLLCGYFDGAGAHSPLIDALPPYLLWRDAGAMPAPVAGLVKTVIACAHDVSRCGESVLTRLCELLLCLILREPALVPPERVAMLRARCDPALRRALDAIHARPARRWTLNLLARNAGLSRSTFAQRFTALTGVPAMTYLRQFRLVLAEKRIHDDRLSVARAAKAVGFRSAAAFRRAQRRGISEVSG